MKKLYIIILIFITIAPGISWAETTVNGNDSYTLLAPLPCISGVTKDCSPDGTTPKITLNNYILYIYKFSIALAVFLAIVMIIWGGFLTLTSETPFKISDGKDKITNAIVGLAMVLASYLILQTIDPRLVDIETNIPAVVPNKADIDALKKFQSDSNNNLNQLSNETKLQIQQINNDLVNLKKQQDGLNKQRDSGSISPEDYAKQNQELKNQINQSQVTKSVAAAQDVGLSSYKTLLDTLNKNGNDDSIAGYIAKPISNTTVNGNLPINSPNSIQNEYNLEINRILSTNSNYDKADMLMKQRDFYIEQAQEEVKLNKLIVGSDSASIPSSAKMQMTTEMEEKYQKDLNDKAKQEASGLTPEAYKAIYEARISTLSNTPYSTKKP